MKLINLLSCPLPLLVALWFNCVGARAAEEPKKKFNNTTVVALVNGKLPPETIVLAIEGNPGKYDISADALLELQKKGVPQKVLDAMIRKVSGTAIGQQPGNQITTPTAPSPFTPPNVAAMMGTVWLLDGTNRVQMKQTAFTSLTKPRFGPRVIIGQPTFDTVQVYQGTKAVLRLRGGTPSFEFSIPVSLQAAQMVQLYALKVNSKDGHRELRVIKGDTTRSGLLKESVVPINLKEVKTDGSLGVQTSTYRASPASALKPGEYVLAVVAVEYDFGVE